MWVPIIKYMDGGLEGNVTEEIHRTFKNEIKGNDKKIKIINKMN